MKLSIHNDHGNRISIETNSDSTVFDIKRYLVDKRYMGQDCSLVFNGVSLDNDSSTLRQCNLMNDSVVWVKHCARPPAELNMGKCLLAGVMFGVGHFMAMGLLKMCNSLLVDVNTI